MTRFLGACSRGQEQRDSAAGISRSAIPADAGLVRAMLDATRWSDAPLRVLLRDRALIATAYVTAARRSELGALLLADVEADGIEFRVHIARSKTKKRTAAAMLTAPPPTPRNSTAHSIGDDRVESKSGRRPSSWRRPDSNSGPFFRSTAGPPDRSTPYPEDVPAVPFEGGGPFFTP